MFPKIFGCAGAYQNQKPRLDNVQQEPAEVARVLSGVLGECWGAGEWFRWVCQLSRCAALGVAGLVAAKPVAGGLGGGAERGFAAIRSATRVCGGYDEKSPGGEAGLGCREVGVVKRASRRSLRIYCGQVYAAATEVRLLRNFFRHLRASRISFKRKTF